MMKWVGLLLRGFVIWLVPFVVSFFFYTPEGTLTTSYALFKSLMIVVLTVVTVVVNGVRPPRVLSPLVVALVYTGISIGLDMLIVVPTAGLTLAAYVEQIALVYIVIAAITWTALAQRTAHVTAPLAAGRG